MNVLPVASPGVGLPFTTGTNYLPEQEQYDSASFATLPTITLNVWWCPA